MRAARSLGTIRAVISRGEQAPDFELPDQDGRLVKLSSLRGKPAVVYFYPKADTRETITTKTHASCGAVVRP